MAIFQATTLGGNINLGSAMAIILGIATFILSIVLSRFQNRKKGAGA
jgi:multiple sugar transport system permease protein